MPFEARNTKTYKRADNYGQTSRKKHLKNLNLATKIVTNRVRQIGNKFLNAVEISAQEAVYIVLQMPMRRSFSIYQYLTSRCRGILVKEIR